MNLGTVLVSLLLGGLTAGLPLATRWFWGKVKHELASHAAAASDETRKLGEQTAVFQDTTLSTLGRIESHGKENSRDIASLKDQQNIHEGMLRVLSGDWASNRAPPPDPML